MLLHSIAFGEVRTKAEFLPVVLGQPRTDALRLDELANFYRFMSLPHDYDSFQNY